jgi:hypothetical protein
VESFGALKERYGVWHLAVRHRGQPIKRIQGNGGSQKKLVAARGQLTRCAIPVRLKGHCCPGQVKDKAVPRTQKGRMLGKRCWPKLEKAME